MNSLTNKAIKLNNLAQVAGSKITTLDLDDLWPEKRVVHQDVLWNLRKSQREAEVQVPKPQPRIQLILADNPYSSQCVG